MEKTGARCVDRFGGRRNGDDEVNEDDPMYETNCVVKRCHIGKLFTYANVVRRFMPRARFSDLPAV